MNVVVRNYYCSKRNNGRSVRCLMVDAVVIMVDIFKDGEARYGPRELSPNIIRRLEDAMGFKVLADGFPAEMLDDEPEELGYEVVPRGRA